MNGQCFSCGRHGENCLPFGYHGKKHYDKLFGKKLKHASRIQYHITGEAAPFCSKYIWTCLNSEKNILKI